MGNVESCMKELNEQMKNDYKNAEGYYFSCSEIASNLKSILKSDGRDPKIFIFRGLPVENSVWLSKPLVPRAYEGRIEWNEHYVCISDGLAYDPILGKPVPARDYCREMFGEDAVIFPEISNEEIRELLSEILSKIRV